MRHCYCTHRYYPAHTPNFLFPNPYIWHLLYCCYLFKYLLGLKMFVISHLCGKKDLHLTFYWKYGNEYFMTYLLISFFNTSFTFCLIPFYYSSTRRKSIYSLVCLWAFCLCDNWVSHGIKGTMCTVAHWINFWLSPRPSLLRVVISISGIFQTSQWCM